ERSVTPWAIDLPRLGQSIRIAGRRTDVCLRRNGDVRRRMDRLLRSASWCPSDRVWHDDAVILLGGTPDWQSRRAGGFDTSERADSVLTSLFMAGAGLAIILVGSSLI